jgi:hypothetical protein
MINFSKIMFEIKKRRIEWNHQQHPEKEELSEFVIFQSFSMSR